MPQAQDISLIGYASGVAARFMGAGQGPVRLRESQEMARLIGQNSFIHWRAMVQGPYAVPIERAERALTVRRLVSSLMNEVLVTLEAGQFFMVLGGDHSSAIGTWSGAARWLKKTDQGELGLIWIDAHMDSHTPLTTSTGNIHGMPLAVLLGHGETPLTHLSGEAPVLKPEHVCLVGVRSFEPEEEELLKRLGVRIFFMQEVLERGLTAVMNEARKIAMTGTGRYGISLDIDSMDPEDAPGTGVPEKNGIRSQDMLRGLAGFAGDPLLLGCEIVEFDPLLDVDRKTERLIPQLMAALLKLPVSEGER